MKLTSGRLTAVVIGIPLALVGATLGSIDMVGLIAHGSEHHVASYPWAGGAVSLSTSSGSVRVETIAGSEIQVAYTEHYDFKRPSIGATTTSGGVQLTASCSGFFANNCEINYVIGVPASAALTLHSGDGDVHVTGSSASISLDTGDGDVDVDTVSGEVVAHTGDGDINGSQVDSANVQASTGDGDVHLQWTKAPTQVVATTGDGDIQLFVPTGSGPYRTSTHSGDGSVHLDVSSDPTASSSIDAESGDGNISVGYR